MFQLRPGSLAMIIGAQTPAGRGNIGKAVELFGLYQPGETFLNPVNGVMTRMPLTLSQPLWLVTGEVVAFDGQSGFAFVRAGHLMPLRPENQPEEQRQREAC